MERKVIRGKSSVKSPQKNNHWEAFTEGEEMEPARLLPAADAPLRHRTRHIDGGV